MTPMSARTPKKSPRKAAPSRPKAGGKGKTSRKVGKKAAARPARRPAQRKPVASRPAAKPRKSSPKAKSRKPPARPARSKVAPKKAPPNKARLARAREQAQKARARERLAKERERERARQAREKEADKLAKLRAKEKLAKERERQKLAKERERERQLRAKERARLEKERQKARDAEKRRREAERERERLEREAERERVREEARRAKEEERAQREAAREAYRLAKEAERERLRRDREAAKRALEGKVARLTKRAQRAAGVGRSSTTRVYRPDAIPNQSGTSLRRSSDDSRFANLRAPATVTPEVLLEPPPEPPAPAPPPPPPPPDRVEERYALIQTRLADCGEEFRREYSESFDMSWIYHDSALEGVVYTYQELKTAIDPRVTVVPDSSMQPVCEEIRRHKSALDLVRDLGEKKRSPITVDVIKKIYLVLHPEEGDLKSVKYRKDIPQHRLYFHEYAPPDKIAYRVRQVVDWLNGPEPKKIKDPIRVAARVQYDLVRVFPFAQDSGKVARLLMNILLLRAGHPPAIMHSTERQRYYEALKGSLPVIIAMVREAINNGLTSIEKRLDDRDAKLRGFAG